MEAIVLYLGKKQKTTAVWMSGLGSASMLVTRWLWALPIQVPQNAWAPFNFAMESIVGNGESSWFWSDWWLQGKTMAEFGPNLYRLVPRKDVNTQTGSGPPQPKLCVR